MNVDTTIELDDIRKEYIKYLELLKPIGEGNEEPIFMVSGYLKYAEVIGKTKSHLKAKVGKSNTSIDCVGFGLSHVYEDAIMNTEIEVACTLNINEFNGKENVLAWIHSIF